MTVTVEEWIYVMLSWRHFDGLVLYVNGLKVASSDEPTPIQVTVTDNNKFFIGSNIEKEDNSYLLFYVSTIDILKNVQNNKPLLEYAPPITQDAYIWAFASIDGDYIYGNPRMRVHGKVSENRGALGFDGVSSYIHDIGDLAGIPLSITFLSIFSALLTE